MNILTISTLYDRGGAAYIARTLHNGFLNLNHNAIYYAGYGKNGFKSKYKKEDIRSVIFAKYLLPIVPHLNYLFHKILGKDLFSPNKKQLKQLINWSDVIICHTVHSHFINYELLLNHFKLYFKGKKILLVAHDSWNYTGRCAIRHECVEWKNNCLKCMHRSYYPSTILSISGNEFIKKIHLTKQIDNIQFISPANWLCNDLRHVFPKTKTTLIRNGINTIQYLDRTRRKKENENIEFCVSSVSLVQNGKVDLEFVKRILDLGFKIHFIGKDNPFKDHKNSVDHGYICDVNEYLDILLSVDCYLFTSQIDIYPTVLVEAICAGTYIFYTKSKGSSEIMNAENRWPGKEIENVEEIITTIQDNQFKSFIMDYEAREIERLRAISFFNYNRMIQEYLEVIQK